MSLLKNVPAAPAAAKPEPPPAWRLLSTETGVQDMEYGDTARTNIRGLFGHQPRRVLDIGCASGAVGAGLKQSIPGIWVWGCELNEKQARVAATQLDRVTTVARPEWSAEDIALVKSLDTVLLLDVLEHMYNPWAELEFLATHLPSDAQVIVSLPNIGHISILQGLAHGAFPYSAIGILDVTHVRFFTLASMHAMFDQTGFRIEREGVLSNTPSPPPESYPASFTAGKLTLAVENALEWDRLNAVQFGFRLRRKAPAPATSFQPAWGSAFYKRT